MEIGQKLKEARLERNITQEKIAELLNCSRQTISNWENNRSYPDIISVIKISDIYCISLDELLKEDKKMINHLEESTNIVRTNSRRNKILEILSYMIVWSVGIIFFYAFMGHGDEMGFSIVYLYAALPITSLVVSIFIGADNSWSNKKYLMSIFFGVMLYLASYFTFELSNSIAFHKVNIPDFSDVILFFLIGTIVSLFGVFMGFLISKINKKEKQ